MNDTAQETTAVMTMLVELKHETGILLVSFLGPAEKESPYYQSTPLSYNLKHYFCAIKVMESTTSRLPTV